ncbi:MAG TPA: N-acetylmuramoyl-L-alanine amidase [Dermatophilaceae bacterium]|nr:N-acetylmuramoyl-L-alanine amidase [Dermatophilaceae bacterium]
MVQIIDRAGWGFTGWTSPRTVVPVGERTVFEVHYDGGAPVGHIVGTAAPQAIDAEHKGNGWAGIGYSFIVDQLGNIFEGRGWDFQGSFCPVHNRTAWAVQVHIGGDEQPSPQALAAVRGLYDEACARRGLALTPIGHRDGYATDCPGRALYAWVHTGMPITQEDPDMNPWNTVLGPGYTGGKNQVGPAEAQVWVVNTLCALYDLLAAAGRIEAAIGRIEATVATVGTPELPADLSKTIGAAVSSGMADVVVDHLASRLARPSAT